MKYPDKYYLTLNKTAASEIGVKFPEELLAAATKVIEYELLIEISAHYKIGDED